MTELEQLKKEYREIPVPADGPQQMLESIARAKRMRSRTRLKSLAKYATIAAAALVVVVLLPRILLFSRGFGGASENAAMDAESVAEKTTGSDSSYFEESLKDTAIAPASNTAASLESVSDYMAEVGGSGTDNSTGSVTEEGPEYGLSSSQNTADETEGMVKEKQDAVEQFAWDIEAISAEILRQMEERMLTKGETYYVMSENNPEGFDVISEAREYYINEEGLLVIVFEAGTVAPKEQGIVEFIIPAEIVSP